MAKRIGTLNKKRPRTEQDIENSIKLPIYNFVKERIKSELDRIVSPFDSNIQFSITQFTSSNGTLVTHIGPVAGISITNPSSQAPDSGYLYKLLDEGFDTTYHRLPSSFRNETFPNSTDTVRQNYDRSEIQPAEPRKIDGGEPRNWSKLVLEDYEGHFRALVNNQIVKRQLRGQ